MQLFTVLHLTWFICLCCSTNFTIFFICHSVFCHFQGQFLSFQVFFKHFFVCFETWIVLMILIFLVLHFGHLYLYTCVNKTLCIIKNVPVKLILWFSWFDSGTFGAWGKIFVWFFKSKTYVSQNKNHHIFFWWWWYLYCVVSNKRFVVILLDNITILFLSGCRFLLLIIPTLVSKNVCIYHKRNIFN